MVVPREGKRIGRAFDEGDDNEDEDDIDELERKIRYSVCLLPVVNKAIE